MTKDVAVGIQALAEEIYDLATGLDKRERHLVSDAATLIKWVVYDMEKPGDPDAAKAIQSLREALAPPPVDQR